MMRALVCTALVAVLLLVAQTGAGEKGTKDAKERVTKATITKIDPTKNAITLRWKDKDGKEVEKTVELKGDVKALDETGKAVAVNVFAVGGTLYVVEREERVYQLRKTERRPPDKKPFDK